MYQAAQAASQADPNAQAGNKEDNSNNCPDDNVVDTDYKEV